MKFVVKKDLSLTPEDVEKHSALNGAAVYTKGDTIEVTRREATQLMDLAGDHFTPADDETKAFVKNGS